jgi:hypothetical protein
MKIRVSALVVALAIAGLPAHIGAGQTRPADPPMPRAESRDLNLRAYSELLRRDIRQQKAALITELMQFTESEDKAFWPIYREYEIELSKIYDKRLQTIETYAENYTALADQKADEIVLATLDLESQRTALKKRYYTALKKALSPRVAARAVQIEHQLDLLVDLQIAASLPVIPAAK